MTASYHLIFPMPAGRTTGGNAKLSVFFVPRLQADGPLTDWAGDWSNWPTVVTGAPPLALQVAISSGGPLTVAPTNDNITVGSPRWLTPPPSSEAWQAAFGATAADSIQVERFRSRLRLDDTALAPPFHAPRLARTVRDLYDTTASEFAVDPPTPGELTSTAEYDALLTNGDLEAYGRHIEPLGDGDVSKATTPADIDFHGAIAFLQAHPELLRTLGLVVDLEVAVPPGPVSVSVWSNFEAAHLPAKAVPMIVDCGADFWPTEGPGGWAPIGDGSHDVTAVDIGSAVSALDAASPAPLRTNGLHVVREGQDLLDEVTQRWHAQAALEAAIESHLRTGTPGVVPVDGEALTVGRRYDVFDESADRWFALWDRVVPTGFEFPRAPGLNIVPSRDEGWMTYTAMTEQAVALDDPPDVDLDPDPRPALELGMFPKIIPAPHRIDPTPLRISPILLSWNGWSQAAHQPGRAFSGIDGPIDRAPNVATDDMALKVGVSYDAAPQSLPRLRYARQYRFRARVVDYVGNSRELSDPHPPGDTETPLIRYGRTSPLEAPVTVRRHPRPVPGWADTPTTLVVRSELDQTDDTVTPTSRLLFPPSTSQYQCELHGLPGPDGLFTDQATFDDIVARTAATIDDHGTPDPVTGELVSDPVGGWLPAVSYLVEPAAAGFALTGVPGVPDGQTTALPIDRPWPQSHAIGIEVRAGDAAPAVAPATPTGPALVAWVPKGVTRQVVSSTMPRATLIDHWTVGASASPGLVDRMIDGQHWMVSQRGALTFVHAVRQPLSIPAVADTPTIGRDLDAITASMGGVFQIDVKSTGSVEVTARWTDPIDTVGSTGGLEEVTTTRVLFDQHIGYDETTTEPIDDSPFEVGDTKRHDAVIKLTATSRYARHFAERSTIRFESPTATVTLADDGVADLNVEVFVAGARVGGNRHYTIDGRAGTITRTEGSSIPVGADVDVDFIRLPITRRADEEGAPPVPIVIPNSAVPDTVPLVDVLPAFSRSRFDDDGVIGVVHEGRTIRVWIERPWFTTGTGELLGVLVGTSPDGPLSAIARDPLSSTGPTAPLRLVDFPAAVVTRPSVDGGDVHVAGHDVQFDETRQQWFADIVIDADIGYRPFARLALVRFQPESIDGAHVSVPVSTGPVRLGATRTSRVQLVAGGVEVRVEGLELGNEVTARFQYADPAIGDVDLAWVDLDEPVVLTPTTAPTGTTWTSTLPMPTSPHPVRVVVEDAELLTHQSPGGPALVRNVAYVDTIALPGGWTAAVPAAPTGVSAAGQNGAVDVSWIVPGDGGSALTGYDVEWRHVGGVVLGTVSTDPASTAALVGGLTNGVTYEFRVRASNAIGNGPWSGPVSAAPVAAVAGPVAGLTARGGHRSALVEWARPIDDGGTAVTGYRVERRDGAGVWGSGVDLPANRTRFVARGLTNGAPYDFRVRAVNAAGDGPWSETPSVTPAVMTPARVTSVRATSGAALVRLRWRPVSGRGAALERHRIERRGLGGAWGDAVIVDGDSVAHTIGPLTPGDELQFRVRAENSIGPGAWSAPVAVTVLAGGAPPARVGGVALAASDGALVVTWSPATDGGSALTGYDVEARSADGATTVLTSVAGDVLVAEIDGLTNGVDHGCRVRAVNVVGAGAWSETVTGSPAP